ncbi:hypothetical protein GCM10009547_35750 [Sporichthya brevicatena]|uniref:Uncharacterized protein n=1 Tax=Sporichthya brevicatena TaxID=171442 RepID=A0ABP3S8E9_9ACTN
MHSEPDPGIGVELIIGVVRDIGVPSETVRQSLEGQLRSFGYDVQTI